jgi:hypothetical protein
MKPWAEWHTQWHTEALADPPGLPFCPSNPLQIVVICKPKIPAISTYDFRTAMKRVGPSVRR